MKPAVVLLSAAALVFAALTVGADAATTARTWGQTSMTFTFVSDPRATGSLCWTDVKPVWTACSSPVVYPEGTFQNGPHTFRVKSVTPDGVSEPGSYSWIVRIPVPPFIPPNPPPVVDDCRTWSPAGCSATIGYAFPAAWVARTSAELGAPCEGVRRVVMAVPPRGPGGYGFKRIVCQRAGTTFTYTISAQGRVQVAAVT
jgi:hypothetical protein